MGFFTYSTSFILENRKSLSYVRFIQFKSLENDLCNKMDYEFLFMEGINENFLNLGIRDSIRDYQNNHWFLNRLTDDSNSIITENHLIEGKIVLFFRITNIKYYTRCGPGLPPRISRTALSTALTNCPATLYLYIIPAAS